MNDLLYSTTAFGCYYKRVHDLFDGMGSVVAVDVPVSPSAFFTPSWDDADEDTAKPTLANGKRQNQCRVPVRAIYPLRLPRVAPPCFDSQEQWQAYKSLANYTAGDGFTFCTDCTPERKARMLTEGRCKYPKTAFIKREGKVLGRRWP